MKTIFTNFKRLNKLFILFFLLAVFSQLGFGQSKATIGTEEFNGAPPSSWVIYSISSNKNWSNSGSEEEINGYNGDVASNDWLISPPLNLNAYTGEILTFKTWTRYSDSNHPRLKVYYSTDYSGSGNPNSATWTQLPYDFPNENSQSWKNSGNVSLSSISGTSVYIGFNYTSSGTGAGSTTYWKLDDYLVTGTAAAGPEMNIKGNSFDIADGDNTPSTSDHTDFGNVCTSSGHVDRTFTIQNTGTATLNLTQSPIVQVTGTGFSVLTQPSASSIASGGADLTFVVRFDPTADGVINGTVSIDNNDSNENPYNFSIQGTGGNFAPTVTSPTDVSVTATTATLGGTISNTGCSNVTERGIYYSTTSGFADGTGTKVSSTSGPYGTGTFSENVTGLSPSTVYYYKAFATNSGGTDYTAQGTFTTLCGTVTTFPFIENFDNWRSWNGTVGSPSAYGDEDCWTNENGESDTDATDWTGRSVGTQSSSTGPSADHTDPGTGNFIYLESSSSTSSKHFNAKITSPTLDISSLTTPYLTFWYHMYGADMGTLKVHIYYNSSWHLNQTVTWNGVASAGLTGDQTNLWKKASLDLVAALGYSDFRIQFEGKSGNNYTSDMAIDDVRVGEKPLDDVTNFTIDCPAKTSMNISWTKPVGTHGTDWDGVIVFARATSAVDAVVSGNDASSYTANTVYGSGTQNANSYCVAKTTTDTDGNITVTGLTAGVKYYFKAYTYKEIAGASNDKWAEGVSNNETAASSIANVTQANAYGGNASATVRWQNISCYDEVLVVGHSNTSVSASPSGDGSTYTPNSTFGSGYNFGSGNYVVYNNVGTGVAVSGLTNGTTYYFKIFVRKGTDWSSGVEVSVTPKDQTWFKPGELIIVGYDASFSSSDKIYLATLVDIKPGTEWYYVNSRFEAGAAAGVRTMKWFAGGDDITDKPGVVRFTNATATIEAGSLITFTIGNDNSPTNIKVAKNSNPAIHNGLTGTLTTAPYGANISGGGDDQLYLLQGQFTKDASANFYRLNGRVLFGLTNGESWKDLSESCYGGTNGDYRASRLHPDLECFNIEYIPRYVQAWYKNSAVHGASKNAILSGLMVASNWSTNSNYSPDIPEDFLASGGYDAGDIGKPFDVSGTGADGTWTGTDTDNDNWFKCGNWEGMVVPDNSMDVIFPNVTNDCSIDYNAGDAEKFGGIAECNNLTIQSGGDLHLDGSALDKLYVMGDLTIESGGNLDMDDGSTTIDDGNLYLYGDYDNQGSAAQLDEGNGTVHFVGDSEQKIFCSSLQEIFYNIVVNNSSTNGVTLGNTGVYTQGTFDHLNGLFNLTDHRLTINSIYNGTHVMFKGSFFSDLTISGSGEIDEIVFNGNMMLSDFIITRTSHDITISPYMYIYDNLYIGNDAVLNTNTAYIYLVSAIANTNTNGRREGTGYIYSWSGTNTFTGNGYFGNMRIGANANVTVPCNFTVNNFLISNSSAVYNSTNQDHLYIEGDFTNNYGVARFNNDDNLTTHFTGTGAQTITASNGQKFYDVNVHSGSDVTTQASLLTINDLDLTGTFTIAPSKFVTTRSLDEHPTGANDRLIIKSDATGTGSLITKSSPPATVERYITGDTWHTMFPTLSDIPKDTYTSEEGGNYTNNNFYSYDETTKDYWNSTTTYETNGWTSEVGAGNLRIDKGYIYNRAAYPTRTISQTGGNLYSGNKIFSITNTVHSGTIGNGCINDWRNYDGWNLVGNPYPSAINWDAVTKTGIDNAVYVYDDSEDKYKIYGSSDWDNAGTQTGGGSQYIPSGQGFFVKKSASGTSNFTISVNSKVHNNQAFWKNNTEAKSTLQNFIRLNVEKNGWNDDIVIRTFPTESGVTAEHDSEFDAYKMFSWNNDRPQLYSRNLENTNYYAINTLPNFTENTVVPLGMYIGVSGEHTINVTENYFNNTHVWLEDRVLNKNTNLLTQSSYTFNQTAEQNNERFFLHFDINHAPIVNIEIPDQTIQVNDEYSYNLHENTFIDNDFNDKITISVSLANGEELPNWLNYDAQSKTFEGVPTEAQILNIKLTATDIFGATVTDYFKLTVQSVTGITAIEKATIEVYPNPTNGLFNVVINNSKDFANITVKNVAGQLLLNTNSYKNNTVIDISSFAKGIYFVDIKIKGQTVRKKIILQ